MNRKRIAKALGGVIASCLLLGTAQVSELMAANKISITYNHEELILSSEPKVIKQSVMLPLRDLSQQLGYKVNWEQATGKIEIVDGTYVVVLQVGSKVAQVNGKVVTIDVVPQAINGVTYVPLRFISEAMEMGVQWNSKESKVALEGKYTVDEANKKLMARTASGKKVVGDIKTYDEYLGNGASVSVKRTKAGSEVVSVTYVIQGALTVTASTTFYIKDGKVIDRLVEEPSILATAGILYKNNEVAISTGTELKIYDDLSGTLVKSYNLKEKLGEEGFVPMSYGKNYIVGRYQNTIHVIDLVNGKVTRILDFIPEGTEEEKEAKYFVYMFDMPLTAQDNIKLAWETEEALVFKYHDTVEDKDKTITYIIGK